MRGVTPQVIIFDEITDYEDACAVLRLDCIVDWTNAMYEETERLIGGTYERPPRVEGIPIVWPNVKLGEN